MESTYLVERICQHRYTDGAMTTPDAVRVADALADSSRLALLAALLEGEATVSDLAARRGLDVDSAHVSRRRFATACLDWTERRPHLGGALGAAVLGALCARGYVRRRSRGREVALTKPLARWLAG